MEILLLSCERFPKLLNVTKGPSYSERPWTNSFEETEHHGRSLWIFLLKWIQMGISVWWPVRNFHCNSVRKTVSLSIRSAKHCCRSMLISHITTVVFIWEMERNRSTFCLGSFCSFRCSCWHMVNSSLRVTLRTQPPLCPWPMTQCQVRVPAADPGQGQ